MRDIDRDDKQIVSDYLNGNEESLKILVDKYLRSIYNFVYHTFHDKEDAEDITAEIFIKAWKSLKKYKPEYSFKTWIFSIARNTTLDWLRKRNNPVFSDFDIDDGGNYIENTIPNKEPLPDELAILAEDKKILAENIARLSPIYQTVLIMRYTEDFTFNEIAEILHKSIDTVKSQHRRALIELRKLLK